MLCWLAFANEYHGRITGGGMRDGCDNCHIEELKQHNVCS